MSGSFGGWILKNSPITITKKPDLNDPVLRAKLAKGMGHNYYGEPAWPNVPNHERHVGKSGYENSVPPFVPVDQVGTNEGNRTMPPHPRGDPHSWRPRVGTHGARPHPVLKVMAILVKLGKTLRHLVQEKTQVCHKVLGRELLSDQWCLLLGTSMDHHILGLCIPCTITCLLYLWSR